MDWLVTQMTQSVKCRFETQRSRVRIPKKHVLTVDFWILNKFEFQKLKHCIKDLSKFSDEYNSITQIRTMSIQKGENRKTNRLLSVLGQFSTSAVTEFCKH
jgi:hypothetical protein